jgi:allantoinase
MSDLVIRGNSILTPGGMQRGALLISNGIITAIVSEVPANNTAHIVDIGDKVLMPGIIDPHVHINEPGRTEWEGFETATRAAVAGGITSLVEMPLNASPVTTTVAAFEKKLAAAKDKLYTNCGFWGGVIPGNETELEGLIDKGVLGFKAFLTHSGIDEFPNVTEADLRKAMPIIAKHGLPLLVHCELEGIQDAGNGMRDVRSYQQYLASRPKQWEDDAIALMIRLCEEFSCRVHIVHLSSANSIEPIQQAKEKGLPLTVETAQHYLFFNAEDIPDGQPAYKCAPPIREKSNNELLWQALQQGIIDFVATDHSPAPPEMKQLQSGDLMKAWGGIASLQFALPVLWTAARQRNIPVTKMAEWLCEKPALLAGQLTKGKIAKGYNADLVIWDPEKKFTITAENIHHRHKITPYLQQELYGVVEQTWLNGSAVFNKGTFIKTNAGKIITHVNHE